MKKFKLKYTKKVPEAIKGVSFVGVVRENDIIEVNEIDKKRLLNKNVGFSEHKETPKKKEEKPEE